MLRQLIFFLLVVHASGSHYRGGSFSWSIRESDYVNGSSTVPVRLYQRHSWRRSAAPSFWRMPLCDRDTIANGTALLGDGSLTCRSSNCYTVPYQYQSISTQVLCTDFAVDYDYASGENYTILQLPINKRFNYIFESCCWIGLLPSYYEPSWGLNLIIDTNRRADGKFNNAPQSTMVPIYKVEIGRVHTIDIQMIDSDSDPLRCRWGESELEAGGIYMAKGELQSNPCRLTYNATAIGYEGVAVVIEDFDSNNQVLSSIPLQFLIEIVPLQPIDTTPLPYTGEVTGTFTPITPPPVPCPDIPEYEGDWGPGACIGVASNNMTEIRIVVKIPCDNSSTSIHDILTISPTGMTRGPIMQDTQYNNKYIMYLQWTPQATQYGIHQLCVTPMDNSSRTGQTVCFNILVDVHSPQFVQNSMSPTGIVSQNQSTWTITTDVDIVPPIYPTASAVFYKRNNSGNGFDIEVTRVNMSMAIYESRKITFNTTDILWEQGQEYYILLDAGVATINQSCGIQSSPIIDTQFWTFSIAAALTTAEPTTTTPEENTIITEVNTINTEVNTTATVPTTTTTVEEISTIISTTTTTTTTAEEISTIISTTTTTPDETTAIPTTTTRTTTLEVITTEPTTRMTTTTTTTTVTTTTTIPTATTTTTTTTTTSEIITTEPTTRMTTTTPSNTICTEWLLFGTIKNVTTNDNQPNYTFCFYVNTTRADVTVLANTWTPCAIWKTSGAADPLMDLYNITKKSILLAQNDDGNSIPELNCYASVISYRLYRGNYQVVIRHPKCNYGRFEVRLSAETTNSFK